MTFAPAFRKVVLIAHVISSIGWIGAVASFLALAVIGLVSPDLERVRAVCVAMDAIAWLVIVPLSFLAPLTGLAASLGTPWGLVRHYWVVVKSLMTLPSTAVLLLHMQPIGRLATAALTRSPTADLARLQVQLAIDASMALVVLLVVTALSVYKPKGLTRYGARQQRAQREALAGSRST